MDNTILTYGVREQRINTASSDIHAEELLLKGFTVVPNVFTQQEMESTEPLLDNLLARQIEEMGGRKNLQKANDDDQIRCPLAYDPHFLDIATKPMILDIIRQLLGENFVLLMQNAIINQPEKKQYQVRWHRDLNYQHWVCSRPLAINFLVCVNRFYKDGGCTWVLPGSHLHEELPSNEFIKNHETPLEAEVGSVVIMNAMTFHRSGINISSTDKRRAINHVVGAPLLAQQIDMPRFLAENGFNYESDPFLKRYLGYQWNPAPSAKEWRLNHTHY